MVERPKYSDGVEFLECKNCDSPCYDFEIDPKRGVPVMALCTVCGNDDPSEFLIPDDSEA